MVMINTIFPVLLMALIGYGWAKANRSPVDTKWIGNFVLFLSGPSLVLSALLNAHFIWSQFFYMFGAASFTMLLGLAVAFIYLSLLRRSARGLVLPIAFINSGNLGFSLCFYAFGQAGLQNAVIFHTATVMVLYSVGVILVAGWKHGWQFLKLPYVYVCALGILLNVTHTQLPVVLLRSVELLGQSAIPLMLFLLGWELAGITIRNAGVAITAAVLRLGTGLVASLIFIHVFHLTGVTAACILLLSSLPSAVMSHVLTSKYDNDSELTASVIAASTLLSLVTIPLILMWVSTHFIV